MSRLQRASLCAALFLAPLALLFPAFRPGSAFLPMHTFQFAPLEHWEADVDLRLSSSGSDARWNGDVVDKLFPICTDALAMREDGMLWSPRWCGGAPVLAQGLAGFLYPPNLLFQVLDPVDAYTWLAWITLSLGSVLAFFFLRDLALHPLACTLGALSYGLSLYSTANLHYYMRVDAAIWLPLAMLALRRSAHGGRALWCFGIALPIGLSFLAGFPQISFFVVYAAGIYLLVLSAGIARGNGRRAGLRFLVTRGACLALGAALAGIQLLPQREASDQSLREATSAVDPVLLWENIETWRDAAMEPYCLSSLGAPFLLGSPADAGLQFDDPMPWTILERPYRPRHTNQATGYNFTENQLYIGLLPLIAAVLALFVRPRRALGPALAFASAVAFAVVLLPEGWLGAPFRAIYSLPFVQIGAPPRVLSIALFFAAWCAALGFDAVIRDGARARAVAGTLLAGAAACAAIAWSRADGPSFHASVASALEERRSLGEAQVPRMDLSVALYREGDGVLSSSELARVERRVRSDFERGLALCALGALALLLVSARRPSAAGALLLLAVAGDLILVGRVPNEPMPRKHLFARPPPVQALIDAVASDGPAPHRIARAQKDLGEIFALLRPNLPGVYGIPDISGYIVAASKRLVQLFAALDPAACYDRWVAYLPLRLAPGPGEMQWLTHRLLDAAGIGYLLSLHPLHEHPDPAVRAAVELLYRDEPPSPLAPGAPRFHVYRRTAALPRAFLAERLVIGKTVDELRPRLASPDWDPRRELLLLEEDLPAGVDATAMAEGGAALSIARYEPTFVRLEKSGQGSGWAYLSDVHWPGWRATVDGVERPIVPANHAFRAVWMNAGETVLEMRYEPDSLRHGAILSIFAAALLALLAWRLSRASAPPALQAHQRAVPASDETEIRRREHERNAP